MVWSCSKAFPSVSILLSLLTGLAAVGSLTGCQPRALDDMDDATFTLVDEDSAAVVFPEAFEGQVALVGFVYTQCPDICGITTANMRRVQRALDTPDDVAFVTVSFDPERDTPTVLRRYRRAFGLDDDPWTFLTGDPTTIDSLMARMNVRRQRRDLSVTDAGDSLYVIDHSDQLTLFDRSGRVIRHYGGSSTPPDILVEDINALR